MFWMLLACNANRGADTDVAEIESQSFVKLYGGDTDGFGPGWCAQRGNGTLNCFGRTDVLAGLDQDVAWLDLDLSCGCGLDLGGFPVCYQGENSAVGQLPPGPFSRLGCDDRGEMAWAVVAETGLFVTVDPRGAFALESGSAKMTELTDPFLVDMCYLEFGSGEVVCATGYSGSQYYLPEGEFHSLSLHDIGVYNACAIRGDSSVACFAIGGELNPDRDPNGTLPALRSMTKNLGLTVDHELIEVFWDSLEHEERLPLGGRYVDYLSDSRIAWDVGIPFDDPNRVDMVPQALEAPFMEVLPPGWE
ncbi:MAG: hypothetical protein ACI9VR_004466 [Cognaticolwellia sp.]|jgi:hypothetical protein